MRITIKPSDKWIIIGSDGLWDSVGDQDAASACGKEESSEVISRNLLKMAMQKGSTDNITILVIKL